MLVIVLHCSMGLVDKALEFYLHWIFRNVLKLNDNNDAIRKEFVEAEQHLLTANEDQAKIRNIKEGLIVDDDAEGGQSVKDRERLATERRKVCVTARAAANKKYLKMMTSLKRLEGSFYSKMEKVFQKN